MQVHLFPAWFTGVREPDEGGAKVMVFDLEGRLDRQGRIRVPARVPGVGPGGFVLPEDCPEHDGGVPGSGVETGGRWSPFMQDGVWGIRDHMGKTVVKPKLDVAWIRPSLCGLALQGEDGERLFFYRERDREAVQDGKSALVDWKPAKGDTLAPWKRDVALPVPGEPELPFETDIIWANHGCEYPKPDSVEVPTRPAMPRRRICGKGKWIAYDESGAAVLAGPFERIQAVRRGEYFIVSRQCDPHPALGCKEEGVIDRLGVVQVPMVYERVEPEPREHEMDDCGAYSDFGSGQVRVWREGFAGVYDMKAKAEVVAPDRFAGVCAFEDQVARVWVQVEGGEMRWGLVDGQGRVLVAPVHAWISPFSGKVARFRLHAPCVDVDHVPCSHGRMGLLDPTGKVVLAPTVDEIGPLKDGRYRVIRRGRMGILRVGPRSR